MEPTTHFSLDYVITQMNLLEIGFARERHELQARIIELQDENRALKKKNLALSRSLANSQVNLYDAVLAARRARDAARGETTLE